MVHISEESLMESPALALIAPGLAPKILHPMVAPTFNIYPYGYPIYHFR